MMVIADPEPSCGSCKHWLAGSDGEGECRRLPPQVQMVPVQTLTGPSLASIGFFPRTRSDIYCGEYTLDRQPIN